MARKIFSVRLADRTLRAIEARAGRGRGAGGGSAAAGRGRPRRFGIVVPFRDTPREREFAEKSLPSAVALGPDEIVVGVDADGGDTAARFVEGVCRRHGFGGALTVARVERSSAWRFHLANVVWHCYKASRNDTVLVFDIDAVLRSAAMRGLELVGRDGNAVVSMTKRILTRSIPEYIRFASLRIRARTGANAFAGLYWIHLPYYFANVREEGLASIANGLDDYMVARIRANGTHRVVTLPDMGEDSLDLQNPDYPWRQFGDGIWHGANGSPRRSGMRRAARIAAAVAAKAAAYQRPHFMRGWWWALSHPDSEACGVARRCTLAEWVTGHEPAYVRNLGEWSRRGTGFDG